MSAFKCEVCGQVYNYRKNLSQHVCKNHQQELPVATTTTVASYQCYVCDKIFALKNNLYRHQRNIHGLQEGGLFFKCTLCPFQSSSKRGWIDHLQTAHQIQLNSEDLQFSNEDEF
ncbi:zinc finger protein 58-like [Schistocerca nitens]|uniref:zinc finger protein 58-like n=1 Tax=Schistocerca nitens TaxID=7011 RepID=UPI0021193999|nr:zinc finger protein 58-like [Schistocerca nitens]